MIGSNILNEILMQYNISNAEADLIRYNENMTYCIDGKYLLRIHKSKPGLKIMHLDNNVDLIKRRENEIRFLLHLAANGFNVQAPIKNINDKFVTVHEDGTVATMLTWIPGRTLTEADLTDQFGYDLGKMLGRMHRAAKGYDANEVINYDQELCRKLISIFTIYYNDNKLNRKYFESISNALELIGDKLKQSEPIYLHSDLSLSNILITEKGLVPIDFSLFGYSSPMLDFGSVFCFVNGESCRENIINGYKDVTGVVVNESEIAYYVSLEIILGIVLHMELWIGEEWFVKRLPEWCSNNFDQLVQ